MKKLIAIGFVLVLALYNFNILSRAQDTSASGEEGGNFVIGLIEDSIINDASQEMSEILKDIAAAAKQSGQSKDVKPLIRSMKRNLDALRYASKSLPPGKCRIRLDEDKLQKFLDKIDKFDDNLCDDQTPVSSRLVFDPMFEQKVCVVGSPDFLMCACPHYPNRPECKGYMSGSDKPDCFAKEDFEPIFARLANQYGSLADAALVDSNMNGKPDACENNGKLPGKKN